MEASSLETAGSDRRLGGIPYILTRAAEIHPERVAIDDLLNGRRVTYAELERDTNRLAHALRERGVRKGDFVALMFPNEAAMAHAMFACAKIGAVLCPVNVRLLPHEVAAYLEPHGIKAVLCNRAFRERFAGVKAGILVTFGAADNAQGAWLDAEDLVRDQPATPLPPATTLEDPFRMIPTGGTTGASKGVVHSHGGTLMTILTNIAEFGIRRGWKTIMLAPLYHGAGMDWGFFPILWRGGTVIMPADTSFNALNYLALLRERQVEFALLVPATILALYKAWDRTPLESVRSVISTSAPTSPALRKILNELFASADVMAGAGISESLNMAVQSPGEFITYPTSIGEPHLDTRACIVDEEGREKPRGEPGEICLRGFNTALYYHANPDAGRKTWRPRPDDPEGLEWCFTGDIGVMDQDGRLSIVDRSKDVIITGGETVPSVEVESAYTGHPLVQECAAIGLPDERWGEGITLVIAKANPKDDDAAVARELFAFGRERLAGYKVPKQIAFLDALPRSHFGKLLKHELRKMRHETLHRPEA